MSELSLKISNPKHFKAQSVEINSNYSPQQKRKLAKAAEDFESLLTSMMLKSMTKTTEGGLFGSDNFGGDILDTVFQSEISSFMTKSQSLGIASQIYEKLTGEKFPANSLNYNPFKIKSKTEIINDDKTIPSITPSSSSMKRLDKYDDIIKDASSKFRVSENLIKSIILTESAAKEKALSRAKAKGLMQLMDGTAKDMGVNNVWDPKENIKGGTKYIAQMLDKFDGDIQLSLAAYNSGPHNVEKHDGIPPFKETQNYVTRVLGYLNYLEG